MNPKDPGSPEVRQNTGGEGAGKALRRRKPGNLSNETLPAQPYQNGTCENLERGQIPKEGKALIAGLGEPDPRIYHDPFSRNPCVQGQGEGDSQLFGNFSGDITVLRQLPHGSRSTSHMGEDHACTPLRDHTRHLRVVPQPRHIVHDLRPTPQRLPSHRSVSRIDGQRSQTGFRRLSDEGQYPLEFLLHCYGIGAGTSREHWLGLVRQLIHRGYLSQDIARYSVLGLTAKARPLLRGEETLTLARPRTRVPLAKRSHSRVGGRGDAPTLGDGDIRLFEELRALRNRLAEQQGVPAYVVFSDATLAEMASRRPSTSAELLTVGGVGRAKLERYGSMFLSAIAPERDESPREASV